MKRFDLIKWLIFAAFAIQGASASGQSFGPELQNTMMPASGGMGGVSTAAPQDILSGINGNPATLSQFDGIRFTFGSGWADPSIKFTQTAPLPLVGVSPYSATSETPGTAVGNIGVTHSLNDYGRPITLGLALTSGAGAGINFRNTPASNGTSAQLVILNFTGGGSVQLTDQLSLGSTLTMGQGFLDAPFSGIGAMTPAYALRGAVGVNYQATEATSLGAYYQTKENFNFQDAARLPLVGSSFDVRLDMPENVGIGIANQSLLDGRLLLAADVTYKQWDNCDLFSEIYHNQWVLQVGSQYTAPNQVRYRLGYVFAENPVAPLGPVTVLDRITLPDGLPAANYLQAQMAVINQHRLSAGIGIPDVIPGFDFDAFGGIMFQESQTLGNTTTIDIGSYYLGAGLTWRFRATPRG